MATLKILTEEELNELEHMVTSSFGRGLAPIDDIPALVKEVRELRKYKQLVKDICEDELLDVKEEDGKYRIYKKAFWNTAALHWKQLPDSYDTEYEAWNACVTIFWASL